MKALTVSIVSGHGSQKIAIKDKNEKDGKDEGRCCAEIYCRYLSSNILVIWPADVDVAYEASADGDQEELVAKANYILDDVSPMCYYFTKND